MLETKGKVYLVRCVSPTVSRETIVGAADSQEAAQALITKVDPHSVYEYQVLPLDIWTI